MPSKSMFYGASPKIFERARILRENMTSQELMLWERIKSNSISGLRFKPQHPIANYIVDFYCHKLKLVIEIDGSIHQRIENAEYDSGRSHDLNELEITVIRFTNERVENDIEGVINELQRACSELLKST